MKTIQEQINNWLDTGKCQCKLCERGRNFARIIQTIESPEDQEWMFWFYDGVVSTEEELGLQEYWASENQKRIDRLKEEKAALIHQLTDLRINAATKQAELLDEKYDLHKQLINIYSAYSPE